MTVDRHPPQACHGGIMATTVRKMTVSRSLDFTTPDGHRQSAFVSMRFDLDEGTPPRQALLEQIRQHLVVYEACVLDAMASGMPMAEARRLVEAARIRHARITEFLEGAVSNARAEKTTPAKGG